MKLVGVFTVGTLVVVHYTADGRITRGTATADEGGALKGLPGIWLGVGETSGDREKSLSLLKISSRCISVSAGLERRCVWRWNNRDNRKILLKSIYGSYKALK